MLPILLDSHHPGYTIGIVAITHGNEIVGLEIFEYLQQYISLQKGRVLLIPSNILAYEAYKNQDDPLFGRFLDHNMNRIWDDSWIESSREYQRREELKPLLLQCDIILDIHSVSLGDDVLGITDIPSLDSSRKWMDVENILIQEKESNSMTAWCVRQGKIAFGIEAGNHTSREGYKNGLRNVLNLLRHYGCIIGGVEKIFPDPDIYKFVEEIHPSEKGFMFLGERKGFQGVSPGEPYARDDEKIYRNETSELLYTGLLPQQPASGKVSGFLFRKMKEL